MSEEKRQQLRDRIDAAQARNDSRAERSVGERFADAREDITGMVKDHPIAFIAGGIALGLAIGAMFPGSPVRKVGRRAGRRAGAFAALASELAMTYGHKALDAADDARHSSRDRLSELGDYLSQNTRGLRADIARHADDAAAYTRSHGRSASRRAGRMMEKMGAKLNR